MRSTKAQRSEAARLLGARRSEEKTKAAQRNGKLGGRPERWRLKDGDLQHLGDSGRWHTVKPPFPPAARQARLRLRQAGDAV